MTASGTAEALIRAANEQRALESIEYRFKVVSGDNFGDREREIVRAIVWAMFELREAKL